MLISQHSLFWNKLGKWQMLAVILILTTFFITLHFTGDKKQAGVLAVFATICTFFICTIATDAIALAAFVALTALISIGIISTAASVALALVSTVFVATLAIAFVLATGEVNKKYGIRKRVVWLSFAAEFVAILLPILLV